MALLLFLALFPIIVLSMAIHLGGGSYRLFFIVYNRAMKKIPTAAMLVIGNEILNGATQDLNINYLAVRLDEWGIMLREARIVRDEQQAIMDAVLAYSAEYDYVFTSGGIGPTHDDITAVSIAAAFKVPLHYDKASLAKMEERYAARGGLSEASKKMAYIPQGAIPIANQVSTAPGFQLRNVYVLAGVPAIFQSMLENLLTKIAKAPPLHSRKLFLNTGESSIAEKLGEIQDQYEEVEIGSYPQIDEEGRYKVKLIFRGYDESQLDDCVAKFNHWLKEETNYYS